MVANGKLEHIYISILENKTSTMMKNRKFIYLRVALLLVFALGTIVSCERDISEDVAFATMPTSAEVFMDGFPGGMDYFPFADSKLDAFSVDDQESYKGAASMRIDVPNTDDPKGTYAGAIFKDLNGRDLSGYDALTFWAKGSQASIISRVGFGLDFEGDKGNTNIRDFRISTNWKKYIIPIPNATKLTSEKGLFWYSIAANGEAGFTVWVDEIQYEKLGNIGAPNPKIFNGIDLVEKGFVGGSFLIGTPAVTYNLGSGIDQTVFANPSYFTFNSTDVDVVRVSEAGKVSIVGEGTAKITATLAGVKAMGSVTFEVSGNLNSAPLPTRDPNDVISIFSDSYTDVPVDFYNGYWEPWQTTASADFAIDGDNVLNYTNFNFVGNQFANPTVNATDFPNLHLNMYIPGDIPSNLDFLISLVDFGADGVEGGSDDTKQQIFFNSSDFVANTWSTLEVSITLANRNNMGLIIYENVNGSPLTNFYLDNIYFYK